MQSGRMIGVQVQKASYLADRAQDLGHPADPGPNRRRLSWRHLLPPDGEKIMRMRAQTAINLERLCPYTGDGALAR